MYAYIIKRLLASIPTIILVSLIAFILLRIVPGDPAVAALRGATGEDDYTIEDLMIQRQRMGTDRALVVQYFTWAGGFLRGDMGKSLATDEREVTQAVKKGLPISAELAIGAIVFSMIFAIPLGVISAVKQNTWIDYVGRGIAITGVTIPLFVFAILLIYLLVVVFEWLPPRGYADLWDDPWTNIKQMFFPILALSFTRIGYMARITRSGMLEVLREDYVRTARSKGLSETVVVARHALQNAMLPVVTLAAFQFAVLIGGTVIIEQIFGLPGMGKTLLESIRTRDYTTTQGIVMTMILGILLINLLVDLLYGMLDPRIRFT
jgi:peptide/nickel transport system permease protein